MVFLYSKKESPQGRSNTNYVSVTLDGNKPESQLEYRRSYGINLNPNWNIGDRMKLNNKSQRR